MQIIEQTCFNNKYKCKLFVVSRLSSFNILFVELHPLDSGVLKITIFILHNRICKYFNSSPLRGILIIKADRLWNQIKASIYLSINIICYT